MASLIPMDFLENSEQSDLPLGEEYDMAAYMQMLDSTEVEYEVPVRLEEDKKDKAKNEQVCNNQIGSIPQPDGVQQPEQIQPSDNLQLPEQIEPEEQVQNFQNQNCEKMPYDYYDAPPQIVKSPAPPLSTENNQIDDIKSQDLDDLINEEKKVEVPEESKLVQVLPIQLNPEIEFDEIAIDSKSSSHKNYCEKHKMKLAYLNKKTGKHVCQKCVAFEPENYEAVSLMNIALEKVGHCKETLDFAQKHLKECEEMDLEKWKCNIRKDLHTYFDFLDQNMKKLKEQALKEVDGIFQHDVMSEIINKKKHIESLYRGVSNQVSQLEREVKAGNYSNVVRKEIFIDLLEKSLILMTIEAKQYQSKIVRRESQLDSLIARIRAMVFRIDDALFSTVFSKVQDAERSKIENLFETMEINQDIPQKTDVTPLYCFYREFIKDKKLEPLQSCLAAIKKWDKIQDLKKSIFFTMAKKHNDCCLEAMLNKDNEEDEPEQEEPAEKNIIPFHEQEVPIEPKLKNRKERLLKHFAENRQSESFTENIAESTETGMRPQFYGVKYEENDDYDNMKRQIDSLPDVKFGPQDFKSYPRKRKRNPNEFIKGVPSNLKVIEKRILQNELEKKIDPNISNKIKCFQDMNNKKRDEKNRIKLHAEEARRGKYEKSQLTRIHRIMRTIG